MNSSTSRTVDKRREKEEIKRKIELLKAQLDDSDLEESAKKAQPDHDTLKSKKSSEAGNAGVMLAPATPSPRKKRKISSQPTHDPISKPSFPPSRQTHATPVQQPTTTTTTTTPAASTLFSSLRRLEKAAAAAEDEDEAKARIERTLGFGDAPALPPPRPTTRTDDDDKYDHAQRDNRLALVEDFQMGPYEFVPPVDDPQFESFEPHSGIALSSRKLPHAELSDYLIGRFYISPSRLYTLLRVDPSCPNTTSNSSNKNKGGYDLDVPVAGDWVTIAVIAERGLIKYTKAPVGVDKDGGDDKKKRWEPGKKGRPAPMEEEEGGRGGGKKYVTLKMIDFGARTQRSSSGGDRQIRGDAFLNLILFEADGVDFIGRVGEGRGKEERLYKGGSGGAFEKLMDVREGDVVALLNPRVLKPFQRTHPSGAAHTTILALTPPSASSIVVLGRSRDLGMCAVVKADGKVCGAWCDKRVVEGRADNKSGVCEYHLERAVQRRRAGRNEFAAGTSGMSTSATHKRKHDYDPQRKWGLKPNDTGSGSAGGANLGATYVFGGHVVSNGNMAASSMFVSEMMGREAQAKARRKRGGGKDKEAEAALVLRMDGKGKGKGKGKALVGGEQEEEEGKQGKQTGKASYSATFVKKLGFDPSLKRGFGAGAGGDGMNKLMQEKLDALEALQRDRTKGIQLGPRPGERVRSGVVIPSGRGGDEDEKMVDLDDL